MTLGALKMSVVALPHAITRFNERVRPGLGPDQALAELNRLLLDIADYVFEAPTWLTPECRSRAPVYAVIGDVVLPLHIGHNRSKLVATTCLTRGGLSQPARDRRNALRRRRADRRPAPVLATQHYGQTDD
jgi:hypothetical protein